jgi:hypothetical protein
MAVVEEMPIVVVAPAERWTGRQVGEHGVLGLDPSLVLPQVCCPSQVVAWAALPNVAYWVEWEKLDRPLFLLWIVFCPGPHQVVVQRMVFPHHRVKAGCPARLRRMWIVFCHNRRKTWRDQYFHMSNEDR